MNCYFHFVIYYGLSWSDVRQEFDRTKVGYVHNIFSPSSCCLFCIVTFHYGCDFADHYCETWFIQTLHRIIRPIIQTGSLSTLRSELTQAGDSIGSSASVSGALFPSNDSSSSDFTESLEMDEAHSLITSISMIAPRYVMTQRL